MDKAKKLQTNAKYLSKFKAVPVRVPLAEYERMKSTAADAGQSPSAYALQAIRERMERDGTPKE